MFVRVERTSIAGRTLVDHHPALLLSAAPLFGWSLFGLLCYVGGAGAAAERPLPFVLLPVLLFVLLGFLFGLLIAGQRRAADDGGGNCERGAGRRARGGHGGQVSVPLLQSPARWEQGGRRVSAGRALVPWQVLGSAALGGAGRVGVGRQRGLLVGGDGRVGGDGQVAGRARGDAGGEGRAFGGGASLFLAAVERGGGGRGGGPPVAEVGDAGFLGRQRIDEVEIWLPLLKHAAEFSRVEGDRSGFTARYLKRCHLQYLGGGWHAVFGRVA